MGSPDIFRFLTKFIRLTVKITAFAAGFKVIYRNGRKQVNIFPPKKGKRSLVGTVQPKKVVIGRNSPSTKSEEVIGRNSPKKNGARLLVATVTLKKVKRLSVGTVPQK